MVRKHFDLFIVLFLTILGAVVAVTLTSGFFRVLLTLPLVLFLPGYALMQAIFANRTMDFAEKSAFTLGLSFAVDVLGGLLLHLTPWGLQTNSWVILLACFTVGALGVAIRRRGPDLHAQQMRPRLDIRQGILFGLAALIVVAALMVASRGALSQPSQRFTQFWILPGKDANADTIQLGINNMELVEVTYKVELKIGDTVIKEWELIELPHGEKWMDDFLLPKKQSSVEVVEALLYRLDDPNTVYRRVTLWRIQ